MSPGIHCPFGPETELSLDLDGKADWQWWGFFPGSALLHQCWAAYNNHPMTTSFASQNWASACVQTCFGLPCYSLRGAWKVWHELIAEWQWVGKTGSLKHVQPSVGSAGNLQTQRPLEKLIWCSGLDLGHLFFLKVMLREIHSFTCSRSGWNFIYISMLFG